MKSLMKLRIIFIMLLIFLYTTGLNQVYAADSGRVAKLTGLKGTVSVQKAGSQKTMKAFNSMSLGKGDTVITGKNSSVKIVYETGTETLLGSGTKVTIAVLKDTSNGGKKTSQKLSAGKIWNKVGSLANADDRFEIETPTVVMGVRGTLFYASFDGETGATNTAVLEGVVEVKTTHESSANNQPQDVTDSTLLKGNQTLTVLSNSQDLEGSKQQVDTSKLVENMDPEMLKQATEDVKERLPQMKEQGLDPSQFMQEATERVEKETVLSESQNHSSSSSDSSGSSGSSSGSEHSGGSNNTEPFSFEVIPASATSPAHLIMKGLNLQDVYGVEIHIAYNKADLDSTSTPEVINTDWVGTRNQVSDLHFVDVSNDVSELIYSQMLVDEPSGVSLTTPTKLADIILPINKSTGVDFKVYLANSSGDPIGPFENASTSKIIVEKQ